MLKLASYDIVFQEVPGEVTLAINLSMCPNRCPGCHSPHLQGDGGEVLDDLLVAQLLERYGGAVSCVCFMGGDGDVAEVNRLAGAIKHHTGLKTAWYTGREVLPESGFDRRNFDYIKTGPWVEALGGLDSPTTNQRFWSVGAEGELTDRSGLFTRKAPL